METDHYHVFYFAGETPYATLKMNRHDAIDAAARFMASIYGDVYNRQLDETMYSRLQYKMYAMELDGTLLMEREDPLTIGIKGCDDPECGQGPLMS